VSNFARRRQVRLEHEEGRLRDAPAQSSQIRHRNMSDQETGVDFTNVLRAAFTLVGPKSDCLFLGIQDLLA